MRRLAIAGRGRVRPLSTVRSRTAIWVAAAGTGLATQLAGMPAAGATEAARVEGTLPSGGRYLIEMPSDWRGTLLLWSPGYVSARGRPASDAPDEATKEWLLEHGYALAGSQPAGTGWAVAEIMPDAIATLEKAAARFGRPERTIAWGASMGGQVTAGLAQNHPERFDGALPLCGSVAGPVAMLNAFLDANWAFKQLWAPASGLELVNISDEAVRQRQSRQLLAAAQASPRGRARIALTASFAQLPTWSVATDPRPAPRDHAAQERQQYEAFLFGALAPRQPLEQRAGGNFSWNTGVDYRALFAKSGMSEQVSALYRQAGLSLRQDLRTLGKAPRITADPSAVAYMRRNVSPTGEIADPVFTLNETGDSAPTAVQAGAYARAVQSRGDGRLLRQAFAGRPGHCAYRPSEVIASLLTLERRIATGHWPNTRSESLNRLAVQVDAGSPLDLGAPGFADHRPGDMLRPDRQSSGSW